MTRSTCIISLAIVAVLPLSLRASSDHEVQTPPPAPSMRGPVASNWKTALARLKPFPASDVSADLKARAATLESKIMVGYQGWFFSPGDGSGRGWVHYGPHVFKPGVATVDLWPDMSETGPDERYPTDFRDADGTVATVFSSYNPKTVNRHFQWMARYGIDGVFLQRFGSELRSPANYDAATAVMDNVRAGAAAHDRTWAVMYDLSGLDSAEIDSVIIKDWKHLIDRAKITSDPTYQHHQGKPVVAIWGVGFNDDRHYTLDACRHLIDFLKHDSRYGGNTIMLGVPYYWLAQNGDADANPALHDLLRQADIISPWSVTRYHNLTEFHEKLETVVRPDLAWCRQNKVDYLPVIFPGFRWENLMKNRHGDPSSGFISRDGGNFFWGQGAGLLQAGANMLYVAMFDEIDEGTAIFKVSNHPPVGASTFGTLDGLPSDHYLWLTGQLGDALKTKILPPEKPLAR